jgi:hypothetical protein
MWRRDAGNYVDMISTALLLDSIIRNSVCTPAKLPCRRVEVIYEKKIKIKSEADFAAAPPKHSCIHTIHSFDR